MIFLRYVVFIFIFVNISFACALCKLETPVVVVDVLSYEKENQRYFDVEWTFEREFSTSTLLAYDMNGDSKPQGNELEEVKITLEYYLKENGFLTHILTKEKNKEKSKIDFDVIGSKVDYFNYKFIYKYRIKTNIDLKNLDLVELKFFDEKEFFDFVFRKFRFKDIKGLKTHKKKTSITKYFNENISIEKKQNQEIQKEAKQSGALDILRDVLVELIKYIADLLTDIKDNNTFSSYIWLLVLSFAYGVIHALGPGHGKSLVASYFFSKDGSILKAFNISLLIGIVHTFSAFLLTFTIYYVLNSVLREYFDDVEAIAIKTSAGVIILIALYLLAQKLKKPKIKSFSIGAKQSFIQMPSANQHINANSCACSACKTNSTDLGVVLAAGIIPCPGTITIFIFTFGLGIYFVGLLSAIWMSLGMSFIIFLAAYLSIKVKSKTTNNPKIKKILEYGSLLFILSLGVILLLV